MAGFQLFTPEELEALRVKKPAEVALTGNPGGHAGVGVTITPGGEGGAVNAEPMNPADAAKVASAGNAAVSKAAAPKKKDEAPKGEETPEPGEPATPAGPPPHDEENPDSYHKKFVNKDGSYEIFFKDGYYIWFLPNGDIWKEKDYGSPDNFPSDEDVKDVGDEVSDSRLKRIITALRGPQF
jgi:hypothetical protein